MPEEDALLVDVDEAAARLSLGRRSTQDLIFRGLLPSVKIGRRRLIAVEDLVRFVDSLREETAAPARLTVVRSRDVAPKEKARLRRNAREPKEAASGDPRQPSRV